MTDKPDEKTDEKVPKLPEKPEEPPIETKHELTIGRKTLHYTVTTGLMPLKNADSGETEANIFFMAYTLDQPQNAQVRPLMFVFNGGPGSSSVWLHLGALGPKRVKMQDEGWMPAPPYQLVANEQTWLDFADLVFIDPVGTGYSRPVKADDGKKYWNVKGDLDSVGEFIRLYLTRYERWSSPLFLAGESYGTTRAAGLAGALFDKGVAFNGIFLISTVLNFQTLSFDRGNDLVYTLYMPTYAATAWYHQRLPADLQNKPLAEVLAEVEAWAEGEYTLALMKGDKLDEAERKRILKRLARYTGIETRHIEQSNLRILIRRFCKELLRDDKRTVGRLDSRFKGRDTLAVTEFPDFDPSLTDITPPYTAMMNDYVRRYLSYKTDTTYEVLSLKVNEAWEWDRRKYPDTSEALRSAVAKNPFMKVFVAQGYYDLATPYWGALYTLNHMDIDPTLRDNICCQYYEAGHMMYLDIPSLTKLKADALDFMKAALAEQS
jgi:carboxypeptidase C (cathepsin A)